MLRQPYALSLSARSVSIETTITGVWATAMPQTSNGRKYSGFVISSLAWSFAPSGGGRVQTASTQFGEVRLCFRLEQPELRSCQFHFLADFLFTLFGEVKTLQDVAVPMRHRPEDLACQRTALLGICSSLEIDSWIWRVDVVERAQPSAPVHAAIDLVVRIEACDGCEKGNQALGIAKLICSDGLGDGNEDIMNFVEQILITELSHQEKSEVLREAV